ncbi:S4 domain-containing protein YaaA [Gemelliphila palaticanis]|uniref:S4 domain-containing protein YaaA n=1 Tax=Gemelliphila palaticanis TaxID=81950 RepID=A0ABX2SYX7_9BACL|nr:S4 domain-containing protein YaaA [Gemella palaticanis]MBF0715640.1 S4 domain-containing protein YaaA [Gemella palaticanis]NYS47570.1 S4 domain-containing protein YaaA [Gemella palaticanis]
MKKVLINSEFITMTQFLKIEGYIGSGGEAKYFLQENEVFLNSELENRRGKKLYLDDVIKIDGDTYIIVNED